MSLQVRTSRREVGDRRRIELPHLGTRAMLFVPLDWNGAVMVAVHGVSRNWREMADAFSSPCARVGAALVVPEFGKRDFKGYQRLDPGARGVSADRALEKLLAAAADELGASEIGPLRLFGFSGGAQFVHRFTLTHPQRVARQAIAAAGYYTMPDRSAPYPYGLAPGRGKHAPLDRRGFLKPTLVLVGDRDTARDGELRASSLLDRRQGRNRVERARRFVLAARAHAGASGQTPRCFLRILSGCDHSFSRCVERSTLAEHVVTFLSTDDAEPASSNPFRA